MPSRIFFGSPATSGTINIALAPVIVEVVIPALSPSYNQPIALAPVIAEVVITTPARAIQRNIALSPVIAEVVITNPGVARHIALSPVIIEVVTTASGEGGLVISQASPGGPGITAALFETTGLVAAGGPVESVFSWEMSRYLNRVGTFSLDIPVGEPLYGSEPLASQIERGWRVSIIQENTHPLDRLDMEYLLYRGYVEDRTYRVDRSGAAVCHVEGSLRGLELTSRISPTVPYALAMRESVSPSFPSPRSQKPVPWPLRERMKSCA